MIAFGPVPSRRLGRSLGINNIPAKTCSYSCVYCQLGHTHPMRVRRGAFYPAARVVGEVREAVAAAERSGEGIDYLTFVPDGEPTLDAGLGEAVDGVRDLGIPVAVITNASLLWDEEVRRALQRAQWVSVKIDATAEEVWRRVDRPHGALRLPAIREGLLAFAAEYTGTLVTETMLVAGLNDGQAALEGVAEWCAALQPQCAYVSVPLRPPAEAWARRPEEGAIVRAYHILAQAVGRVECLVGHEEGAFGALGEAAAGLLDITAVHPMRRDAVDAYLARAGGEWSVVVDLMQEGALLETHYDGVTFYSKRLR